MIVSISATRRVNLRGLCLALLVTTFFIHITPLKKSSFPSIIVDQNLDSVVSTSIQGIGYAAIFSINPAAISNTAMGLVNVLVMGGMATFQILFAQLYIWAGGEYTIILISVLILLSGIIGSVLAKNSQLTRC